MATGSLSRPAPPAAAPRWRRTTLAPSQGGRRGCRRRRRPRWGRRAWARRPRTTRLVTAWRRARVHRTAGGARGCRHRRRRRCRCCGGGAPAARGRRPASPRARKGRPAAARSDTGRCTQVLPRSAPAVPQSAPLPHQPRRCRPADAQTYVYPSAEGLEVRGQEMHAKPHPDAATGPPTGMLKAAELREAHRGVAVARAARGEAPPQHLRPLQGRHDHR